MAKLGIPPWPTIIDHIIAPTRVLDALSCGHVMVCHCREWAEKYGGKERKVRDCKRCQGKRPTARRKPPCVNTGHCDACRCGLRETAP